MREIVKAVTNSIIKSLAHLICRIEASELKNVPEHGPLILAVNHVNFLDVPLIYLHLLPRPINALIKIETWDNPLMAFLFNQWGGIPIRRGEIDRTALKLAQQSLERAEILAVAPEGTRSETGILQPAKPGVALLALRTGTPILPVAVFGHENIRQNIMRLKRTSFQVKVGTPFTLYTNGQPIDKHLCLVMTGQIMAHIARLLPSQYRGAYQNAQIDPLLVREQK